MTINSLRSGNMIVPYNEHPHKMKKGGPVKKADGGPIEGQDPLVKKTTPAAYDSAAYKAGIERYKKEKKDAHIPIELVNGAPKTPVPPYLSKQLVLLKGDIKKKQDLLFNYMKEQKLSSLESKDADSKLQGAGLGTYDDYISQMNNHGEWRDITTIPKKELNQKTDLSTFGNTNSGGGYMMETTIPFDSTHYNSFVPGFKQQKKDGGGIKGYITGGSIQEDREITDPNYRTYGNSFGDYAHDVGLGVLDWGAQGFGGQDLIKAEDYNTKAGVTNNRVNSGVGTVASGIGGAVLNYYVPGLGTAARTGKKGVGKMAGEDKGISDKDKATMAKIDGFGDTAGGIAGGLGGMKKKGGDGQADMSTVATVATPTLGANPGTPDTISTNKPAPVTDGSNLTGQAGTDWQNAKTGEAQASVLAKYNRGEYGMATGGIVQMKADGGKIVGPGTGTSDSIKAKPEEGSFIVPAENAKAAEQLREKYLGKPKGQIASLKKSGGVDVMLSNGEHMFTKDEADLLRAKGVDLDALAPNADVSASGKAEGGEIDGIIAEINKQEAKAKAAEELRKKQYAEKIKEEKDASKKAKLEAQEKEDANTASQRMQVLDHKKSQLLKVYSEYQKAPEVSKSASVKPKQQYVNELKNAVKVYQDEYKKQNPDSANTPSVNASEKPVVKDGSALSKMEAEIDQKRKELGTTKSPDKAPSTSTGKGIAGAVAKPKKSDVAPYGYDPEGNPLTKETVSKQEPLPMLSAVVGNPAAKAPEEIATVASQPNATGSSVSGNTNEPNDKKTGILSNIDYGQGLALAQTGLGISSLLKDGKRPVDSIDADFAKTVEEAKIDSATGLSPIEAQNANRAIDKNRAADVQTIINLSGGNAGVALGNIRAASIAANDSKNNLSAMSERLRIEKKRYADSLVSQKAGMSKQLFNEKLVAFNQDQEAGAMLLGAGIRNVIGADRYKKEVTAQEERDTKYNPIFNIS